MSTAPVSDEIAAAFAAFFQGGAGPTHAALTRVFVRAGYSSSDPYDASMQSPSKSVRVETVLGASVRRQDRARELVDGLLALLRAHGSFIVDGNAYAPHAIEATRRALSREGWMLGQDGDLRVLGGIDLQTGGRAALEELLARLRQGTDDPGLLLGSAKDLLEAVPKFVLQEVGWPIDARADFDQLWHFARERLGILPQQISGDTPGGRRLQVIVDCSWKLAREVNLLRVDEGAGHGRTLPTGVSRELALFVVREGAWLN